MEMDDELREYMGWLQREHADDVDFVVLYGSRARGTHRPHSDYDILIGLQHETSQTYDERLFEYNPSGMPLIEAKPFTPSQLEEMWFRYKRMMLDPLYEGIVLLDRGGWKPYQEKFAETVASGILERDEELTWCWHKTREPENSKRLEEDRRLQAIPLRDLLPKI